MSYYYKCENPEIAEGNVIGNGECVSYIRKIGVPASSKWKIGKMVNGNVVDIGTIIATFVDGVYPQNTPSDGRSMHAAIFDSKEDNGGIYVWDQWAGQVVHRRLIKNRNGDGKRSNDASAFAIVLTDDGEIENNNLIANIRLITVQDT